jgi:Na+-translocating ferredoxin:NAD+ oxidoreductase subunit G
MQEMIKMVVVLTILSSLSGGLLAALKDGTKERIENQELELVKGPALRAMLKGASNDVVADRFKIMDGETERSIFVGKFDGNANTVAFETETNGFADKVGLMVAFNVTDDKLVGMGVTTHKETPGLGARAKTDTAFAEQFKGLPATGPLKVTQDGGNINALGGATITSRGVCAGVSQAIEIYKKLKPTLVAKLKDFSK